MARRRPRASINQPHRVPPPRVPRAAPKPYVPPPLPTGSYDPALDAQRRAAARGLGDVTADIGTANTRDTVDYGLGREDILRGQTRGLADLAGAEQRVREDHDRAVQVLGRGYRRLAGQQRQTIDASGLGYGGAALQAAARRAANESFDRQPIETSFHRANDDIAQNRSRLNEDVGLQLGRLALELAPPGEGGPLGGRRFQDRSTQLSRAQREDIEFGLDIDAQKAFQAAQSGYVPPPAPLTPQQQAEQLRRRAMRAHRRAVQRARVRV